MGIEFEDLLEEVGSYGKYQKLMVGFLIVPMSLIVAINGLMPIYQTSIPENHWCDVPGRENTTYNIEEWKNLTIPRNKKDIFEKCIHFDTYFLLDGSLFIDKNSTKDCNSGWLHHPVPYIETVSTAKGWLCDRELYSTHLFAIWIIGTGIGCFILPILADSLTGRRAMFYIAVSIFVVFNLFTLIAPSYGWMMVGFFFAGMGYEADWAMPYVIVLELVAPSKRSLISFYGFFGWTLGMCLTAVIGWLIPHWWYLSLISSLLCALLFAYWWYLPESPRWLLARGRTRECMQILKTIAKTNGVRIVNEERMLQNLKQLTTPRVNNAKEILKTPRLMKNGIILFLMSPAMFIAYFCVVINVDILPNNPFLSLFVLSAFEIPSNFVCWASVTYLGRKFNCVVWSILGGALCLLATFFLDKSSGIYLLCITALMKIFISVYTLYVYPGEVFPTPMRSTALGLMTVSGMIGNALAPYIVRFPSNPAMQYYIMIILLSVYMILSLFLPETLGLPLPQTFEEANDIGKDRPLLKWIHHWNQRYYTPVPVEDPQEKKKEEHWKI